MSERMVKANGIDIWTEDFGNPSNPCILLVMGATAQGILWQDEFCQALADAGRHVIRYDNRDTGQSTCFDFTSQPYTLADLANDALGVLDAYGVERAHIVGASMGGMIAQTLAIEHPERILTVTSIMSTPAGRSLQLAMSGTGVAGLPGPAPRLLQAMVKSAAHPPTNDAERIETAVRLWGVLAGSADPIDEAAIRARETRVLARARNIAAAQNHGLAVASSPDRMDALRAVTAPTLVIHGTDDPICPVEHGKLTAACIPGAALMLIDGMGHDLPARVLGDVLAAIVTHTGAASGAFMNAAAV